MCDTLETFTIGSDYARFTWESAICSDYPISRKIIAICAKISVSIEIVAIGSDCSHFSWNSCDNLRLCVFHWK